MKSGREKLKKLMDDPKITEIMINGSNGSFIEKAGKKSSLDIQFSNDETEDIIDWIFRESGKNVSPITPYADICMEDGSRANVIIAPLARKGTSITIRKFFSELDDLDDLIEQGTMSRKMADFLIACVKGKLNIIFSGGTGAGKTTTMEMLSKHIPEQERVITIEDTAELKLHHHNLVALETRVPDESGKGEVTLRDLIKNSLRMRPDRIIIGEVRGSEALDMIQAMTTGHKGTMGVVHGSSPREVVGRMETMILSSGIKLPLDDIRKMMVNSLDLIVQQERFSDGIRRITHITELRGLHERDIELHNLFAYIKLGTTPDGEVRGDFKSVIKTYPAFYSDFVKSGLLNENAFKDGDILVS
ncbi:MAG: CpaF family protein [Kiritimatiellaeota bacterium]|nr:CpaF family protein [Kiritimatiellota bacterium]